MDDLLIRIMTRLIRVYDELGDEAFENAANRALVTIARSVQLDAERKAGVPDPVLGNGVVPFRTRASSNSSPGGEAA